MSLIFLVNMQIMQNGHSEQFLTEHQSFKYWPYLKCIVGVVQNCLLVVIVE